MLNVSALRTNDRSFRRLFDSTVDHCSWPIIPKDLFKMINIFDLLTIRQLLKSSPNSVIHCVCEWTDAAVGRLLLAGNTGTVRDTRAVSKGWRQNTTSSRSDETSSACNEPIFMRRPAVSFIHSSIHIHIC